MMEYSSQFDFFLGFKALIDDRGNFIDYILICVSCDLQRIINIKSEKILGKKLSEISLEHGGDILALRDIYYNAIPNTKRKFEKYSEELGKWYSINIFSDDNGYLLLFYNDITRNKKTMSMTIKPKRKANI